MDQSEGLRSLLKDPFGRIQAQSTLDRPSRRAPRWFEAALSPALRTVSYPVPGTRGQRLLLRSSASSDLAALWTSAQGAALISALAIVVGLVLIYIVIGRALSPLSELSRGLEAIGQAAFDSRVDEQGPPELLPLQRGFNAMASRLAQADERNRTLEAQLLTIQDEERAEIARDLHDEIGPHLFAVALDAEMIGRRDAAATDAGIADQVRSIQSAVSHMQRQVRELIARLRPTKASELGLKAALNDLVGFWRTRRPEVAFSARFDFAEGDLPERVGDVIYRVVQEATANALRHTQAVALTIEVAREDAQVITSVRNLGLANTTMVATTRLGIVSMHERVRSVGGAFEIDRAADGWTVSAFIPLSMGFAT